MTNQFSSYLLDNQLINSNEKTILAVSGGIDSIVLCHLFKLTARPFAIAHCNFKLRENASDEDESFVKNLAQTLRVPFFSTAFATEKIAQQHKQSIQVVARDLRYEWLEKIRTENGYDYIATAHHLNDSVETVFYNFTKGCGIRGLHGILPKNGRIIRPLLFATKEEILAFAHKYGIAWREDASNSTDKYARNKIRHHVIPILKELNPSFEKTAAENINRLRETEALYDFAIQQITKEIVEKKADTLQISIQKLQNCPAPIAVLFEILQPYDFNNRQVEQIIQSLKMKSKEETNSGKTFFAKNYCLLIDRDFLILKKETPAATDQILIYQKDNQINLPDYALTMKIVLGKPTQFSTNNHEAIIDFEKLHFPLKLRKWQSGDVFFPLGMKGKRQKLQDFFSNQKLTKFDKEAVWLLENRGEICWVVGYRVDDRYKVTDSTNVCLYLEIG